MMAALISLSKERPMVAALISLPMMAALIGCE